MSAAQPEPTPRAIEGEIAELKRRVLAFGALVQTAIGDAAEALVNRDRRSVRGGVERDRAVSSLELQCDDLVRRMMPFRDPAEPDLRAVLASIRVINELERMGDLAASICEGVVFLAETPIQVGGILGGMDKLVQQQVSRALRALDQGDATLAMDTIAKGREIDALYRSVFRTILARMVDNPHHISDYMIVSDIAKTLEWIGDHAANIGETVIYAVRGTGLRPEDHDAMAALLRAEAAG